ncbi:hypothetical protein ASC77_19910 [Nocardioides sp. Root1257]|nr:hypothetical protein ASC77_19910 [Nocardioides sp. Root1257]
MEVADLANTSVGALKNLESGRGANVRTLIRVLRALGLDDWLGTLYVPRPTFNPLDLPAVEVTAGRRVHDGRSVASMSDRDDS